MEFPKRPWTVEKPPLGLKPTRIVQKHRLQEIDDAIIRFVEANYPIPTEWLIERNELIEALKEGS